MIRAAGVNQEARFIDRPVIEMDGQTGRVRSGFTSLARQFARAKNIVRSLSLQEGGRTALNATANAYRSVRNHIATLLLSEQPYDRLVERSDDGWGLSSGMRQISEALLSVTSGHYQAMLTRFAPAWTSYSRPTALDVEAGITAIPAPPVGDTMLSLSLSLSPSLSRRVSVGESIPTDDVDVPRDTPAVATTSVVDSPLRKRIADLLTHIDRLPPYASGDWRALRNQLKACARVAELPASQGASTVDELDAILDAMWIATEALQDAQKPLLWPKWVNWAVQMGTCCMSLLGMFAATERDEKQSDAALAPIDLVLCTGTVLCIATKITQQLADQYLKENPPGEVRALRRQIHLVRSAKTVDALNSTRRNVPAVRPGMQQVPRVTEADEEGRSDGRSQASTRLGEDLHRARQSNDHLEVPRDLMERLIAQIDLVWALPVIRKLAVDPIEVQAKRAVRDNFLGALSTLSQSDGLRLDNEACLTRSGDFAALADAIERVQQYVKGVACWEEKAFGTARMAALSQIALYSAGVIALAQLHLKNTYASASEINRFDYIGFKTFAVIVPPAAGAISWHMYNEAYRVVDNYKDMHAALKGWERWKASHC